MTNNKASEMRRMSRVPKSVYHIDKEHMNLLHEQLTEKAQADDLLEVAYRTMDTPIGALLLVTTQTGLLRLGLRGEDHDEILQEIADTVSPRILEAPKKLDPVVTQLDRYFQGKLKQFDLPLDMSLSKGFRLTVLNELCRVGFGKTVSYTDLARSAGSPRAVRAAGSACATNPIPVIIPCHRVLRTDGSLGGYLGGLDMKRALLNLEGVKV